MKVFFFIAFSFLLGSKSFAAGQSCMAVYAAGMGYMFNQNSVQLGAKEEFKAGESVQDKFYKVSVAEDGQVTVQDVRWNWGVPMKMVFNDGSVKLYQSGDLDFYPENVPGAGIGSSFIFVGCVQD